MLVRSTIFQKEYSFRPYPLRCLNITITLMTLTIQRLPQALQSSLFWFLVSNNTLYCPLYYITFKQTDKAKLPPLLMPVSHSVVWEEQQLQGL